jgi:hypothetical protein
MAANFGGIVITNPNEYYNENYYNNKFQNISNVSEVNHYYMKQPFKNEFIIKCSNNFFFMIPVLILTGLFVTGLIFAIYFQTDSDEYGLFFAVGFVGFIFSLSFWAFLMSPIRHKFVLEEMEIRLTIYHLFCCIPRTITYKRGDIKKFEVAREIKDKANTAKLIYYDKDNKKRVFPIDHNFTMDEAEYFVYVANNYV